MDIQTDAPVLETPVTPTRDVPADDAPLSAHIEAFHSDTPAPTDAQQAEKDQRRRNRAQKDRAHPEDVPRIKELTGKVKDAETRAERAEREAGEWKQKYESRQPESRHETSVQPVPEKFTYQTFEDAQAAKPDLDWNDWNDARNVALYRWDTQRTQQTQSQEAQTRQADEAAHAVHQGHQDRLNAYVTQYPDRKAVLQTGALPRIDSPLLVSAILKSDNSPDVLYRLVTSPDTLDEAILFAHGKPVDEYYVAAMQRWLQKRVSAGMTGAVPPAQIHPAPRPPTPVRTTPVPPTDEPPGDNASLRDHAKAFNRDRRR